MNSFLTFFRRRWQIFVALIVIAGIFYCGFYIGSRRSGQVINVVGDQSLQKGVDLSDFWKAWDLLNEKFAPASTTLPKITDQNKVYGAIAGLAASYGDPYTTFFPPVESKAFNEEISGSFSGVGMEIDVVSGSLTVVSPIKGSPAEKAGVKAGDKIIKIDDTSAEKLSTDDAVKLIRGENGTSVTVTFMRQGVADPIVKTLVRDNIEIPVIDTKKTPEGVFVISLYSFSATSPDAFRGALRQFVESGSNKLVLDLRDNPGGYLEAAIDMASWFLPPGKVVVSEDFGGKEPTEVYKSKGYDVFNNNLKMAILVNGGSASAAEILSGALQQQGKAVLVGENTFGKGSVQELMDIDDKTSLKITVAHWYTPNGKSISNGGLTPDIEVKMTDADVKAGKDPQLQAAVDYLLK